MKLLLFFTSLAIVALASSCKKDSTSEPPSSQQTPQQLIIGNWKVTKLIIDGEDALAPDPEFLIELQLALTQSGTATFKVKGTDLTVSPPEVEENTLPGTYSWSGNQFTISINDGIDILSVTGNVYVSQTRLVINATSGDTEDFFSLLEADRL